MSSTANRVIKNTGFLYAKMGITMFISLYTTRLILNSLGASDFGIFNIVGGAISMLGFLNAAMASATQRFMSYSEGEGNKEKQKSIFNVSFILHLIISLIVGVVLLIAGYFFFNGILNIPEDRIFAAQVVYGSLIVSTMFTVMTVPYDAAMNAHENMKYYAIVGVLESLLKLLVAFACVYTSHDKLIVYGAFMACIPLITLSIMRIYCHKNYEECIIAPQKYWNKGLMKEMTSFAGWNFIGSAVSLVTYYGSNIILNHFFGTILNAAYGIANQLNGQLMTFSNNMLKAINPVITKREGKGDRSSMIKISFWGCKTSFFILSLVSIPAIIEMPYILKLWIIDIPKWAVIFTQLQLLKSMIGQITVTFGTSLSAQGNIKKMTTIGTLITISVLPITYLFFSNNFPPPYIYIINITVLEIGIALNKIYFMHVNCKMRYKAFFNEVLLRIILISISTFVIGYLVIIIISTPNILRILITFTICFIVQTLLAWFVLYNKEEKDILKASIEKILNKIRK